MRKNQNGFGTFEVVLIAVVFVVIGTAGWLLMKKVQNSRIYHVVAIENYTCQQTDPPRCKGKLRVTTLEGRPREFALTEKTKYTGVSKDFPYQQNIAPFNATLELKGTTVKRLTLHK